MKDEKVAEPQEEELPGKVLDIITDEKLLAEKSIDVDLDCITPRAAIVEDLLATARANKDKCLSLAGNQIGVNQRIAAVRNNHFGFVILMNPVILSVHKTEGKAKYFEGCLSRPGKKAIGARRAKSITLRYHVFNDEGQPYGLQTKFHGIAAQTVQHMIDHMNGRLI